MTHHSHIEIYSEISIQLLSTHTVFANYWISFKRSFISYIPIHFYRYHLDLLFYHHRRSNCVLRNIFVEKGHYFSPALRGGLRTFTFCYCHTSILRLAIDTKRSFPLEIRDAVPSTPESNEFILPDSITESAASEFCTIRTLEVQRLIIRFPEISRHSLLVSSLLLS